MNRRQRWGLLLSVLALALTAPSMAASPKDGDKNDDAARLSVTVAFGFGLNTASPTNHTNHQILPKEIRVRQGGVVHFIVAGFHQPIVYLPGTRPDDIVVPPTGTFINDLTNVYYLGLNPAATPPVGFSNAMNRVESVSFPNPGTYLVICNVRVHFLDGMFAFVKVVPKDDDN